MWKYYGAIISLYALIPYSALALSVLPNDTHVNTQSYISQIHLDEAWGYSVGSDAVVVAVIDSGVDTDHPDLKNNLWVNQDEIPQNGIDDDKNGYIDDRNGWNFVEKNNNPNPVFFDYSTEGVSHGTLVAGIIAAQGHNSEGIAGIAWNAKIMPLRALNSRGEGTLDDAAEAVFYAASNGADVINLSFVGSQFNDAFKNALEYAHEKKAVIVAAVGNDSTGIFSDGSGSLDTNPVYPACLTHPFDNSIIGVGAVDAENKKAIFSNFGSQCIDINAPGTNIVSTQVINPPAGTPFSAEYSGFWNGTSFAAPQVAGVAALIKSVNKGYNNNEITAIILDTADSIDEQNPEFENKLGKGLLNARRALKAAVPANVLPADPRDKVLIMQNSKALWVSDTIAASSTASSAFPLKFTFKNTGAITWNKNKLSIKLTDWNGNPIAFTPSTSLYLGTQDILPSQSFEWHHLVKTPTLPGNYKIKVQLLYDGIPLRGGSLYKTVHITSLYSAVITKHTFPLAVLKKWKSVPVTVGIKNNSSQTWYKETAQLSIKNSNGFLYIEKTFSNPQEKVIQPGQTATFIFNVNIQNAPQKKHYFDLLLTTEDTIIIIEGGSRVMRID